MDFASSESQGESLAIRLAGHYLKENLWWQGGGPVASQLCSTENGPPWDFLFIFTTHVSEPIYAHLG